MKKFAIVLAVVLLAGCSGIEPHGCSIGYKVGPADGCNAVQPPKSK